MNRTLKNVIVFALIVLTVAACTVAVLNSTPTTVPTGKTVTDLPGGLEITDLSFTEISGHEVAVNGCTQGFGGVGITLRVSYNSSPLGDESGEWRVIKELGVPCFNEVDRPIWDISSLESGTYLVRLEAKTPDDPNWTRPVTKTVSYQIVKGGKG